MGAAEVRLWEKDADDGRAHSGRRSANALDDDYFSNKKWPVASGAAGKRTQD